MRSEWLDAYFEKREDGLWLLTGNKTKSEKLEDCLMEDQFPGIDFESWISGAGSNSQGLPKPNIRDGDLYYWYPRSDNNSVARFSAGEVRAGLNCIWDPSDRISDLGVRAVKEEKAK